MTVEIQIEYPPSVNSYYRSLRKGPLAGRVLISEKGREYRKKVAQAVRVAEPLTCALCVDIVLFPPDRRKRDIDNTLKAMLDALTHAGVWVDDSQIKRLSIEMTDIIANLAVIKIRSI